jgi:hypothetical protein
MEKSWRLQRYTRKDYSELVEFPVEIVGRDGVVRRYTFEDSIRLYRRRITFAPIRYRDGDLVAAEVEHCRARVDQLRRSYFYRYGWGTPEGQPAPVEIFGSLAGELAAFLCRVLKVDGRPELRFEPVRDPVDGGDGGEGELPPLSTDGSATGDVTTWYVVPRGNDNGMLLYVHRFEGPETDEIRERFFQMLKAIERNGRGEGDVERLIAFHHTVDCGFVLTGRGTEFDALIGAPEPEVDAELTPWELCEQRLRRGENAEALLLCRRIVAQQPWHLSAYQAGAVLANRLEQPFLGEDLAMVGARYFPDDAILAYECGLGRALQGRTKDAIPELRRAIRLQPNLAAARVTLATLLAVSPWTRPALAALDGATTVPDGERPGGNVAVARRLEQWLIWRRRLLMIGVATAMMGILTTLMAGWVGMGPVVIGSIASVVVRFGFDRELSRIADLRRLDDLPVALRRVRRRSDGPLVS